MSNILRHIFFTQELESGQLDMLEFLEDVFKQLYLSRTVAAGWSGE